MTLDEIDEALAKAIKHYNYDCNFIECRGCYPDYLKIIESELVEQYEGRIEFVQAHLNTYSCCIKTICKFVFLTVPEFNKEVAIQYLENEFVDNHSLCDDIKAFSKLREMIRDIQLPCATDMEIE